MPSQDSEIDRLSAEAIVLITLIVLTALVVLTALPDTVICTTDQPRELIVAIARQV